MNYLGIDYSVKNMPALDPGFIPFGVWAKAYLKEADHPFKIAVERDHGKITVYETRLRGKLCCREHKICRAARQNASLVGWWLPYLSSGRRYDRRADPGRLPSRRRTGI